MSLRFDLVSRFDLFVLYPLHLTWHTCGPRTSSARGVKGSHHGKTNIESQRVRFFEIIFNFPLQRSTVWRAPLRTLDETPLYITRDPGAISCKSYSFSLRCIQLQGDIAFVAPLPSPRFAKDQARDAIFPFFRQNLLESGRTIQEGQVGSAGIIDKGQPAARTVKAELLRPPFKRKELSLRRRYFSLCFLFLLPPASTEQQSLYKSSLDDC